MSLSEIKSHNSTRLLLISPFFYPEPISTGKYNSALAQTLLSHVFSVDVIASFPLYPDWKPKYTDQGLNGITIHRGGAFIRYPVKPLLRRLILEIWFAAYAVFVYLKLRKNINLLVVVFPPSLFFAFLSFLIPKDVEVVGIVHDLQGVYSEKKDGLISRMLTKCIVAVEQRAFNSCNKLIFLSKTMSLCALKVYDLIQDRKEILYRYPFVSMNSSHLKSTSDVELEDLRNLFSNDCIHIVYSGALGEKQNPYELLKFFELIVIKLQNVKCHIFSRGPLFESLLDSFNFDEFKDKIFFHDLVPEESLQELYDLSTIQIIPQSPSTSEGSLPSKLPNLLSCGVPIFAICDEGSELSEIVNASGIGRIAHTWDPVLLVAQISDFIDFIASKDRHTFKTQVSEYVNINFSIAHLVDSILS